MSLCFNCCLSYCIFHQSYLTKVISLLVLKHLFSLTLGILFLLSNQFPLSNDVKSISLVTLFNNYAASWKFLLSKSITELFFLIWINLSQYLNFREDLSIVFSFLCCWFLNNMIEGCPIQSVKFACCFAFDWSLTRSIIHQCELTKELSCLVCLEICLFLLNHFPTVILPLIDDVENVSLLALGDDGLSWFSQHLFHGINNNVQIVLIQRLK